MNDDELVRKFLKSNIRLPEDNGFSERVMSRLPRRSISVECIWVLELVTFVIGIAFLLIRVDLLQVFCNIFMQILQFIAYLRYVEFTLNPIYIIVALVALTVWGGNKIRTSI